MNLRYAVAAGIAALALAGYALYTFYAMPHPESAAPAVTRPTNLVVWLYIRNDAGKYLILHEGPLHPSPRWNVPHIVVPDVSDAFKPDGTLDMDNAAMKKAIDTYMETNIGIAVRNLSLQKLTGPSPSGVPTSNPLYGADMTADAVSGNVKLAGGEFQIDISGFEWVSRDELLAREGNE